MTVVQRHSSIVLAGDNTIQCVQLLTTESNKQGRRLLFGCTIAQHTEKRYVIIAKGQKL